jgi:pSer/pThr/pTyr-binding forkhead associated (FHA) protein
VQAPRPTAFHLVEMTPTKRVSISTEKKLGIGRGPENEVSLPNDLYASKDHAAIVYEGGRYWLEDLGSKNGTRINGTTVHNREPINRGDVISIGDSYFLVE